MKPRDGWVFYRVEMVISAKPLVLRLIQGTAAGD